MKHFDSLDVCVYLVGLSKFFNHPVQQPLLNDQITSLWEST